MNLLDFRTIVKDTLGVTSNSDQLFPTATLNRYINKAVGYVQDSHNWVQSQKSMKRNSVANKEDYSIPTEFKDRTIEYLEFNDKLYTKVKWLDYLKIKKDYGNGGYSKPVFGVFEDKFFLNPMPSADGVADIIIWGQKNHTTMSADADVHDFVRVPRLEEAIIEQTLYYCFRKLRGSFFTEAQRAKKLAEDMIEMEWQEQKRQRAKEQTVEVEMFEHIDFLNVGKQTRNGTFDI